MKSGDNDNVNGSFHEAKGAFKEMAGKITDDPKLEAKGKFEKIAGKAQQALGRGKKFLDM